MSTRTLLGSSHRPQEEPRGQYGASTKINSFRLQPPPLKRKERRNGQIFDSASGAKCPPPSSTFTLRAPQGWHAFPNMVSDVDETSPPHNRFGERECAKGGDKGSQLQPSRISPKDIFKDDVRLYFPEHSMCDSPSGQSTPRASTFSSKARDGSSGSCQSDGDARLVALEAVVSEPREASLSDTASPPPSATSAGTFGQLRRRGSVACAMSQQQRRSSSNSLEDGSYSTAHTVVLLSPCSPRTPCCMAALHSPTEIRRQDVQRVQMLKPPNGIPAVDFEPLSATLKQLGAARRSHALQPLTESDANLLGDESDAEQLDIKWCSRRKEIARQHKESQDELKRGREAAQEAEQLFRLTPSATLSNGPEPTLAADVPPLAARSDVSFQYHQQRVQSTARGARKIGDTWSQMQRFSTNLAAYIFGNHLGRHAHELEVFYPSGCSEVGSENHRENSGVDTAVSPRASDGLCHSRPSSTASQGDGWGGHRPRASWFPNLSFGPLISPRKRALESVGRPRTRSFHLQPLLERSKPVPLLAKPRTASCDDDWEDSAEDEAANGEVAPHYRDSSHVGRSTAMSRLRVHFPNHLPQPSKNGAEKQFDNEGEDATLVCYKKQSVEGGLRKKARLCSSARRGSRLTYLIVTLLLLVLGAMAAYVAFRTTQRLHGQGQDPEAATTRS